MFFSPVGFGELEHGNRTVELWQAQTRRKQGRGVDGGKLEVQGGGGEALVDVGLEELDSRMKRAISRPDGRERESGGNEELAGGGKEQ